MTPEYGNSATLRNRDQINPYPGGMQSGGYQSPAMNTGYNPTGGYNDQSRGPNYGGDPTYGGNQYGGYSTGQPVQFGIDQSKQNSAGRGMNTGSYGGYDPNYNNPSYPQQQYGGPTGGYDYSAPTGRGMPPPNPLGGGYMPNQQQDMYGANPPYRGA